ncbi:thiamine pyrophosphate-binding protein [Nocardia cyriacigeorgica]|uniref:thiamine pyrophosphate-binding protein n=1 Tax=Nocardia cyriacigeorgica TaxID=135487 RepID=UPI0018941778|nr:thiamine pyrophosphate-binding protein [Nocardia cyriacigeorgica]MBF6099076.1 thiamine pyrophosphate-binding protein [Nocardia cyriacigeorgica]MBF6159369.1 thiamine pyrophosphate-binding protein [Nocardia cyriacigeorgica]MBF6198452.1 thiamine pyrophosphate-binding protein [Nocardia cyriacigeorgica]
MPDRVVDYLVRTMPELDVRHIFGVDGANIEDLYDAIFEAGGAVTGVVAKHEFSAATMADGYARSTGGLGVVAATSGGGAMNLVAGLAESYASRVPVLALIGQPPTTLEGHGAFQDSSGQAGAIDAVRLFSTISRYCARVAHPAELPERLARALRAGRRGGPSVLLLPKDVQQAGMGGIGPFRPDPRATWLDDDELERVLTALETARRLGKIVVIAGDQVARDDARTALAEVVAELDALVGVAPDAKDTYDNFAPAFCGVAGTMGHRELADALAEATLCLLVGTPMPVTARTGLDELLDRTAIASIGMAMPHLPTTHATCTDVGVALRMILARLRGGHDGHADAELADSTGTAAASPVATAVRTTLVTRTAPARQLTPLPVPESHGPGLHYRQIVEAIQAALPEGADVFVDAGNTGAAVVHQLRVPRDGRFVVALGMGGMGYAFGAGIGSAFARSPEGHRTVVIAGDGSFYMHGLELHTAVEYALPVTFIVFNNNAHAMCVTREQLLYRDRYSFNRFHPALLGEGMAAMVPSLKVRSVHTMDQLPAALTECLGCQGPSFVSIDCDPDEIPPFLPFLRSTP